MTFYNLLNGEEDRQDILAALRSLAHPYALTREELLTCAKRVCDMVRKLRIAADGFSWPQSSLT